jgi:hypothetical protein
MKTLLDSNKVAVFFENLGDIKLQDNGCEIGPYFNYQYNTSNAEVVDMPSPEFLLPGCYKREGGTWVVVNEDEIDRHRTQLREKFVAEQKAQRKAAYTEEADPVFFKYQRGECEKQDWLDKVQAIRARFPLPGEIAGVPQIPVTEV